MDAVLLAEDVEGTLSVCRVDTGARYTQAFRGVAGSVPHRGVACLGKDYIVAASKEKAVLHVWTWTKVFLLSAILLLDQILVPF